MNRIQLIDLDTSSEEEETGGMMISRKEMQSRLGWLSTEVEPHMKQETETMEIAKEVEEVHKEAQIQAAQEDQPSHTLTSTKVEPHMKQETETMEMVKDVEKVHEEEQIQATQEDQLSHALTFTDTLEVREAVKDEYVETSKEQKDVVEK